MNRQELIEYYYNSGQMPLHYYNQLNSKTSQENYAAILKQRQKENESFIMYVIRNTLQSTLKTALNEILSGLKI